MVNGAFAFMSPSHFITLDLILCRWFDSMLMVLPLYNSPLVLYSLEDVLWSEREFAKSLQPRIYCVFWDLWKPPVESVIPYFIISMTASAWFWHKWILSLPCGEWKSHRYGNSCTGVYVVEWNSVTTFLLNHFAYKLCINLSYSDRYAFVWAW